MRTLAQATRAFEMMCERAVSRFTKGEQLARKQMVQEKIADSWIELRQFRLLILETAWLADQGHDWRAIRANVAAVKADRKSGVEGKRGSGRVNSGGCRKI